MTMITAVISGKGAPGATTVALAMALSWPRPVLLIEADPAGASIPFGHGAGADMAGHGLAAVPVAERRTGTAEAITANLVQLVDTCWLLPGVASSTQAATINYGRIGQALPNLGLDVIVDVGRIPAPVRHDAIWVGADRVLLATRATLPAVHAAQTAAAIARELVGGATLRSVIVGPGRPYARAEVEAAMRPVAPVITTIDWDPAAAGVLADAAPPLRHLERSALLRSAAALSQMILDAYGEAPDAVPANPVADTDRASRSYADSPARRLPRAAAAEATVAP